jgi:hypothetical protein
MKFKRVGAEDWLWIEEDPNNCTGLLLEGSLRINCFEPFWLTCGTQIIEGIGGGVVGGLRGSQNKVWLVHGEDSLVEWDDQEKKTKKASDQLYARYKKTRWKFAVAALLGFHDVLAHMTATDRKNTRKNAKTRCVLLLVLACLVCLLTGRLCTNVGTTLKTTIWSGGGQSQHIRRRACEVKCDRHSGNIVFAYPERKCWQ